MVGKIHLPESDSGSPEQNAGVYPRGARGEKKNGLGHGGPDKVIHGSLFLLAMVTGVEFGGHHSGQISALEDTRIFA